MSEQQTSDLIAAKEISSRDARIAILEHALRHASGKLQWLAQHHLHGEFAKTEANALADKLWKVQSGEQHSLMSEVKV